MDELAALGAKAKAVIRDETVRFLELDREINQALFFGFVAGALLGVAVGYGIREVKARREAALPCGDEGSPCLDVGEGADAA
jgi:hypothetical protein